MLADIWQAGWFLTGTARRYAWTLDPATACHAYLAAVINRDGFVMSRRTTIEHFDADPHSGTRRRSAADRLTVS